MLKVSIVLSILVLTFLLAFYPSQSQNLAQAYAQWKKDYGTLVNQEEDFYRQIIFFKNYKLMEEHNSQQNSYLMGLNQFSHLTSEEFLALFANRAHTQPSTIKYDEEEKIPSLGDVDWEKQGKVTPVRDQGSCDAGYAFCTTSLFESSLLFQKKSASLAPQQLIDCGGDKYTIFGCSGGSRSGAINYTLDIGVENDKSYPYQGKQGQCKVTSGSNKFKTTLYEANGCTEMRNLLNTSPMTVAVNLDNWASYKSGILSNCGPNVQHDVYLVGATNAYWRIKNSWGTKWGESGYIRIAMGNTCGVCSKPGYGFKP